MTMLGATDGEDGHSYLEIAEWLAANSADATADLHELWRRMAFSQLVRNTDDHLRNHGFLLTSRGWRLSPMFDVNPNPDGGLHFRITRAGFFSRQTVIGGVREQVAPV